MSSIDTATLSDFVLVATHGGFRSASRISGRSKATLSRRVAELEVSLGLRLFERNERGLRLTEAGEQLLCGAREPLAAIDQVVAAISAPGRQLSGRLRISAAVVFAHVQLTRIAAAFSLEHPELEIEISADDRLTDPVEDGFDIVIRANPAVDERLVGRCIGRTDRVAVAAPHISIPVDDEPARLLAFSSETAPSSWRLRTDDGVRTIWLRPALRLSTLLMLREAALQGAGVALLPRTLVAEDLQSGRLRAWGVLDNARTEVWALHTSRRLPSAKVTTFLRYLEATLAL